LFDRSLYTFPLLPLLLFFIYNNIVHHMSGNGHFFFPLSVSQRSPECSMRAWAGPPLLPFPPGSLLGTGDKINPYAPRTFLSFPFPFSLCLQDQVSSKMDSLIKDFRLPFPLSFLTVIHSRALRNPAGRCLLKGVFPLFSLDRIGQDPP